jgi:hypothetical protein
LAVRSPLLVACAVLGALSGLAGCKAHKPKHDLEALTTVSARAADLAADATHVYWSDEAGIKRAPRTTSAKAAPPVAIASSTLAQHFLIDEGFVYWAEFGPSGKVMEAPKGGGPARALLQPAPDPTLIGQDDDALYVTVEGAEPSVKRVPKQGGPATLAWNRPAIAAVADATSVYLASAEQIVRVSRGTGAAVALCKTGGLPRALSHDDVLVYWTAEETSSNALFCVSKSGGPNGKAKVLVDFGTKELPRFVVAANGAVYYTTTVNEGASVYRRTLLGETTLLGYAEKSGHSGFAVQGKDAYLLVAPRSGNTDIESVPSE